MRSSVKEGDEKPLHHGSFRDNVHFTLWDLPQPNSALLSTSAMPRIIFTLEDGTQIETELESELLTIGRHIDSHVVLPSASVSSHHATIKRRGGEYFVQDLGTINGTKLNGVQVEEARLSDGDQITFGNVPAVFRLEKGRLSFARRCAARRKSGSTRAPDRAPRPTSRGASPPVQLSAQALPQRGRWLRQLHFVGRVAVRGLCGRSGVIATIVKPRPT